MEIDFQGDLGQLFEDARYDGAHSRAVVKSFRKRVTAIYAATDERDIRAVKGNHFEKLSGKKGEHSIRLNDQWRLIMTFEVRNGVKTVVLLRIVDYH